MPSTVNRENNDYVEPTVGPTDTVQFLAMRIKKQLVDTFNNQSGVVSPCSKTQHTARVSTISFVHVTDITRE
jgi:hypothetical protein